MFIINEMWMGLDRASAAAWERAAMPVSQYEGQRGLEPSLSLPLYLYLSPSVCMLALVQ